VKGRKGNQKLSPKFYGPFEILNKVGKVAYHLNLPEGSLIHPVFHMSQLKKRVGSIIPLLTKLPLVGPEGKLKITPAAILDRRVLKRNNEVVVEVLVQWDNLPEEETSWEDYYKLKESSLKFVLRTLKTSLEGRVLSAHQCSEGNEFGLGIVRARFESVNTSEEKANGSGDKKLGFDGFNTREGMIHNYLTHLRVTGEDRS
jgi:Chromo (CHRromatin Organisation MOdifier) domain